MRLIDADKLKSEYEESYRHNTHVIEGASKIHYQEHGHILHILNKQPTIEAKPVRHGHWHGEADGYADGELVYDMWECSNCGWNDDGMLDEKPDFDYCPHCGAKMDEVD